MNSSITSKNNKSEYKHQVASWFEGLQSRICDALEQSDGKSTFRTDQWERKGGGGGKSRIISDGDLIEKGGVNFSAVWGEAPKRMLEVLKLEPADFFATGVSIVLHPKSPMVPIIHMNVRYFEMTNGTYWFGGGIDLTPHYIVEEDAQFFHQQMKDVCNKHHPSYYNEFKKRADDYFFIPHRDETRGIGGIFFDHLRATSEITKEERWSFVKDVGEAFAPTYIHLANKNRNLPYSEREINWQHIRRGRYVEFNLVYDKGTKFGLDTNGRTESILMSLPPNVKWLYNHQPEEGSKEAKTLSLLKKGINW